MIIGLSGYAGSGKDTVGIIIQWLQARSRKEDVNLRDVLRDYPTHAAWLEKESGWGIKKYAGKLKQIAAIILGWNPGEFDRQEVKQMNLGKEWDEMSVRTFLQRLGTDAMRDGLHKDVWGNALWADYFGQNWIITDVRFVNEAQRLKEKGGVLVRINRPDTGAINQHISETALDHWQFDHVIDNDEGIEALMLSTIMLLKKLKLYENNQTRD